MSDASEDHIAISVEDSILRLKFNRPDKKNAITIKMYHAMSDAIAASNADQSIRAILIEGSGGCFTSGNDLKDFQDATPQDGPSAGARFIATVPKAEKPIVAAVNGFAIGIGTTLLLHCDLVYAAKETVFHMPFVNLGLVPEFGSSLIVPSILGQRRAAELLLLGKPFGPETARELGIINSVHEESEVLETAMDAARALAAQPPAALRKSKALMRRGLADAIAAQIKEEDATFAACLDGPEAAEAFQAFMEKRKPDFTKFN
jgi:enoyl-CoA hydratase/carnithine racemase